MIYRLFQHFCEKNPVKDCLYSLFLYICTRNSCKYNKNK